MVHDKESLNTIEMEKTLEKVTDPTLQATLLKLATHIKKADLTREVEDIKKQVIKRPIRPEQQIFAIIPHQLAKTSIFFPMSSKELNEENRRISKIEHPTNWGRIVIEGVKLAIFEEDIFLALLYIAKDSYIRLKDEFILETNINKIINFIYGRRGYSKRNEDVILRTLKHFELVSFDIIVGDWKKKGKERLKIERIKSIGNIISGFDYNKETKNLEIYFNPRFFAFFLESMLTNINFTIRRKLKKDGSKALLRFLYAHKDPGRMHILTVLNAINYNINQPMYELRRKFKSFARELRKVGVLGKRTRLYKNDTVFFDILKPKKALPD